MKKILFSDRFGLTEAVLEEGTWDSDPWVFVYEFRLIK